MRRLLALVCSVACVLGLVEAVGAGTASAVAPARVEHLVARSLSSRSVELSWTDAPGTELVTVRVRPGSQAPLTMRGGHLVAAIRGSRHTLTVHGLLAGERYAFALFAGDGFGHRGRPAAVLALVAPAPVRQLQLFAEKSDTLIRWTNPTTSTLRRIVVRYAAGPAAPAAPYLGRPVPRTGAMSARLSGLARNREYSISVWALDRRGGRSTPAVARFTTPERAGGRGTITGRITDSAGHPLSNAEVTVLGASDAVTTTGGDGRFVLAGPAGPAYVLVSGQHITGGISDSTGYQAWSRAVRLRASRTVFLGSVALATGAAVSGRVLDQAGNPVAGAQASLSPVQDYLQGSFGGFLSALQFLAGALAPQDSAPVTAADGTFTVRGVDRNSAYQVCASLANSPLAGLLSGGSGTSATSCAPRPLLVRPGVHATVPTVVLDRSHDGAIAGSVTAAGGGGLARSVVELLPTNGDPTNLVEASTDGSGAYHVADVPAGRYEVCAMSVLISDRHPTGFAPQCAARPVLVRAGGASVASVTLPVGAAVTGTVRGPYGQRVAGVAVSTGQGGGAVTDDRGHYLITGLPAGPDSVCFDGTQALTGPPTGTLSACYAHHAVVQFRAGLVRTGIDGRLPLGGAVSGAVRTRAGAPARAFVEVIPVDQNSNAFGAADTDAHGHYTVRGLPAGRYIACFSAESANSFGFGITAGSSSGSSSGSSPSPSSSSSSSPCGRVFQVRTGRITSAINGRVAALSSIVVAVHDADGLPVAGVDAAAIAPCAQCSPLPVFSTTARAQVVTSAMTGGFGNATLAGLTPGRYAVCLSSFLGTTTNGGSPTGYADTCSASTYNVTVRVNAPTHVNLTVTPGGVVSGTVTDAGGHALAGVVALVSGAPDTDFGGSNDPFAADPPTVAATTGADGRYTVIGVRPGARTVCFDAAAATGGSSTAGYDNQCRGAAPGSTSGGAPVTVTAAATTGALDIALTGASAIAGTVRNPRGQALGGVLALVFAGRNVNAVVGQATTGPLGHYQLNSVPSGSYTVCFLGNTSAGQCYRGVAWPDTGTAPPLASATLVTAAPGQRVAGINGTLAG